MSKSSDPKEWLKRAKSSLILAKKSVEEGLYYEDLCFNAQQSAEKSLKALIVDLGMKPVKTHSFMKLIGQLNEKFQVPEYLQEVLILDPYAVITRYPDDYIEITEEEYKKAIEVAENIYNWVVDQIR